MNAIPAGRRARWYPVLLGMVVGSLLTGALVPLTRPHPSRTTTSALSSPRSSSPDDVLSTSTDEGSSTGVTTADTSEPREPSSAGTLPSQSTAAPGGGDATGVTASTIKVGVPVPDLGGAARIGVRVPGADPEDFYRIWRAYVEAFINERGGINGRKVQLVFRTYDPLTEDSMRATCLALTKDEKVFAVLDSGGAYRGAALSCITVEHRTLMLQGYGVAAETQQQAAGMLWTIAQSNTRILQNQVAELHRQGLLQKATIGVLSMDCPTDKKTVDTGTIATLAAYRLRAAAWFTFSCDVGTAASQVPVAVSLMRRAGVDLILDHARATESGAFAQQADRQLYDPLYVTSDYYLTNGIIFLAFHPASFRALSVTARRVGEWQDERPEPAPAAECSAIARARFSPDPPASEDAYGGGQMTCAAVQLFAAAARNAGSNPTRQSVAAQLAQLRGAVAPYNINSQTSFAPGKYSGGDFVRLLQADMDCPDRKESGTGGGACWHVKTEPARAEF